MDKDTAGAVVNSLQYARTGRFWDVETCTGPAHDEYQISLATNPFGELITDGAGAILPSGVLPVYPKAPHCNKLGLTELGEYFVRGMIKRGMIVEVDHMSVRARRQTLNILQAERYSGVITSHSWSDPYSQPRILRLGGMATPMAGPASSPDTEHSQPPATCCYLDTWQRLRSDMAVGQGRLPIAYSSAVGKWGHAWEQVVRSPTGWSSGVIAAWLPVTRRRAVVSVEVPSRVVWSVS